MKNLQSLILAVTILSGCTSLIASSTSKLAYKVDYDYSQDESEAVHFSTNDSSVFAVAKALLKEFPGIKKENARNILSWLSKNNDDTIELPISAHEFQLMLNFAQGVKPSFKDFGLEDFNNMRRVADRVGLDQSHKNNIINAAPLHYACYLKYRNLRENRPIFFYATAVETALLATTLLGFILAENPEQLRRGRPHAGALLLTMGYSLIYFMILCSDGCR